jgi:argininosuccinate lyase
MAQNKMWGGRFEGGPAAIMEVITPSIDFDKRLASQDIAGSKAHARMLAVQQIISQFDAEEIVRGLDTIEKEIAEGKFTFSRQLEDIHLNIESRLKELIGDAAGRLHTARSRNDQVVTDFRLWVREACVRADKGLEELQRALYAQAEAHFGTIMPGYTHMQPAQPVTFGHHCLAYVEMFYRDRGRFTDCSKRLNESPLGAAALAGTPFPIDRDVTAKALGFARPMRNSLDAVSARDFALEYLAAATIAATHLSRLAGEIVQWSTPAFGFVRLSDAFTTGSSIMPQKRNPDAAELIRGKTGRVLGDFVALATVVKGLALAYGTDLQEDKERVFDAADTIEVCIAAMAAMFGDLKVNPETMLRAAEAGYPTATDLADWIVRTLKEEMNVSLEKLPLAEMQAVEPGITEAVFAVLPLEASVKARMSYGGTAPDRVREQLRFWKEKLR